MVVIAWLLDFQLPAQSFSKTTNVVSSKPANGELYSIQHYVIKFVSDLSQVGGFRRVLRQLNWRPRYSKNIVKHHTTLPI